MEVFKAIKGRRSIRRYQKKPVKDEDIYKIIEAARWAPSGLNNQPWRFKIIKEDKLKEGLADFTRYRRIIKESAALICVFLDKQSSYHREKDIMAIGACIQNMLLSAYELGIGSCWLGEILKRKKKLLNYLKINSRYELMAVISLGYPLINPKRVKRKKLEELILR